MLRYVSIHAVHTSYTTSMLCIHHVIGMSGHTSLSRYVVMYLAEHII